MKFRVKLIMGLYRPQGKNRWWEMWHTFQIGFPTRADAEQFLQDYKKYWGQ